MASHVPLRKRFLQLFKPWLPGAFRPSVLAVDGPSVQCKRGAVSGDLQSTELPIESTRGVFRQEPQELPCSSGACHRVQRRRTADSGDRLGKGSEAFSGRFVSERTALTPLHSGTSAGCFHSPGVAEPSSAPEESTPYQCLCPVWQSFPPLTRISGSGFPGFKKSPNQDMGYPSQIQTS